jgi:hypothetical protein
MADKRDAEKEDVRGGDDTWSVGAEDVCKSGFSTCLRVCTFKPPLYIGRLLNQGRGGNRNLFCRSWVLWDACFVVVVLHIVCFMHVPQVLQHHRRKDKPPSESKACSRW